MNCVHTYFDSATRAISQCGENIIQHADTWCQDSLGCTLEECAEAISKVAMTIFTSTCVALLFLSNSSLFVVGMVTALLNPEMMDGALVRIQSTWERQSLSTKALLGTAAFFGWPITLAVTALFAGGYFGLQMQK